MIDNLKSRTKELDGIIDNLNYIMPLLHRVIKKKLFHNKAELGQHGLLPPHYEIMRMLHESGQVHISSIADGLFIPRPQMTYLIDRLVDMGMVERNTDPSDRRMLDVQLSSKGKLIIEEHRKHVRNALKESMADIPDDELKEVSASLQKIREVFSKL
jgi:DNA-binding MarR family transcriptional regulator